MPGSSSRGSEAAGSTRRALCRTREESRGSRSLASEVGAVRASHLANAPHKLWTRRAAAREIFNDRKRGARRSLPRRERKCHRFRSVVSTVPTISGRGEFASSGSTSVAVVHRLEGSLGRDSFANERVRDSRSAVRARPLERSASSSFAFAGASNTSAPPSPRIRQLPMKGFSKSLKAGMSAAAQAANDTLPAGYKFTGATSGGQRFRAPDVQTSPTPTRSPRRGDDGACEPGAHLLLRVEHAVGLDPHPTFVAVRVASALGELRGARAHTLPARPSPSGRHVWRATRNLRCVPRRGDLLPSRRTSDPDVTRAAPRGIRSRGAASSHSTPFHQTARPLACRYTETSDERWNPTDGRSSRRRRPSPRPDDGRPRFAKSESDSEPAADERSLRGVRARADPGHGVDTAAT